MLRSRIHSTALESRYESLYGGERGLLPEHAVLYFQDKPINDALHFANHCTNLIAEFSQERNQKIAIPEPAKRLFSV